jgi:hypothetical protein
MHKAAPAREPWELDGRLDVDRLRKNVCQLSSTRSV